MGNDHQTFSLPEGDVMILESEKFPSMDEAEVVRKALARPIDSAQLSQLVGNKDKVRILYSDVTRLWVRHHVFMPLILNELNKGGVKDKNVYGVCALGDHRDQTDAEFRKLLGVEAYNRLKGRIYNHHSRDEENIYLGRTTFGSPVEVNKRVTKADKIILTGGIVYHFLFGWGGGKKAIMPGVSSRRSIMANHGLALNSVGLDPNARAGKMKGNRCSEDALEVASFLDPTFLFNVVVNKQIGAAVAGNWITAHEKGAEICEKYYGVPIKEQADLTIISCGGYPQDINFYQSYKTLYNAESVTKPGGVIILLTESREGMGNKDFYHMFIDYSDVERKEELRKNYTIGGLIRITPI